MRADPYLLEGARQILIQSRRADQKWAFRYALPSERTKTTVSRAIAPGELRGLRVMGVGRKHGEAKRKGARRHEFGSGDGAVTDIRRCMGPIRSPSPFRPQ